MHYEKKKQTFLSQSEECEGVEMQDCGGEEGGGGGGGIASEGGRMGFLMGNQRVVLSTNEFEKGLVFHC